MGLDFLFELRYCAPSMKRILLLGPQGSGKGTQAQKLSELLGVPALSMGQLLRDVVASGNALGERVAEVINAGRLVSDEIALDVLKHRLEMEDAQHGYVLDGYPRNMAQMNAYEALERPTDVIVLLVPREESLKRLMKRAVIEGRADDTPELIDRRLAIYEEETKPVIERYAELGLLREVDGVGTIEEIAGRVRSVLNQEQ